MSKTSLPTSYFDELYAADPDPWRFATSDYEREKYAVTLSSLRRERYRSALEVGCSIGVLTRQLARRCERLLAVDPAARPLAAARERCADQPWVEFAEMAVPGQWPSGGGGFDLIVLSEVVYYLDRPDVVRLATKTQGSLESGGEILLVHWTGQTDYPLSGDEAAEAFLDAVKDVTAVHRRERHDQFRLDLVSRV